MTIFFAAKDSFVHVEDSSAGKLRASFKAYISTGEPKGCTVASTDPVSKQKTTYHVNFDQVAYIVDDESHD